jgi:DNA polymerase-3 subunit chi
VAHAPGVLVNLGAVPPDDCEAFDRVIEVIGTADDERQGGRARWRHYESWGVRPLHHGAG